jgi:prepilin-type N-terminal cleavage/methylation domain-containing protein
MPQTKLRSAERGFTIIEVLVSIAITAIAVYGVTGAVLGAMHAQSDSNRKASLDDDALAVLSDVRMMTVYDPTMLEKLSGKSTVMNRALPGGGSETISISIAGQAASIVGGVPTTASGEVATVVATSGTLSATERETLYQQAPSPGSVVDEQ